jgi:adenine deaminase
LGRIKANIHRQPAIHISDLAKALVVIPELRISDVGIIDVTTFQKVDLFV